MKKYKLLQWYPAIPKWLEVGDTVENTKDIPDCYFAIYKGAGDGFCQLITNKKKEVENNPEFWGEVEEITMSEENNINLSSDDSNLYANTGNTGDVKSFQDVFKTYEIDFTKVNDLIDLNDVIRILKAMKITFNAFSEGEYDEIMHLLKEAQTEK
jgi:hypothetical protein